MQKIIEREEEHCKSKLYKIHHLEYVQNRFDVHFISFKLPRKKLDISNYSETSLSRISSNRERLLNLTFFYVHQQYTYVYVSSLSKLQPCQTTTIPRLSFILNYNCSVNRALAAFHRGHCGASLFSPPRHVVGRFHGDRRRVSVARSARRRRRTRTRPRGHGRLGRTRIQTYRQPVMHRHHHHHHHQRDYNRHRLPSLTRYHPCVDSETNRNPVLLGYVR